MDKITVQRVGELLRYDADSGKFFWRVSRRGRGCRAGNEAGTVRPDGYIQIKVDGLLTYAHILAWAISTGEWPGENMDVDHIDRDRSNNAFSNLRLATRSQNLANTGTYKSNSSGAKGVLRRSDGRFVAQLTYRGKSVYIGVYDDLAEAANARRVRAAELWGEFAA